MALSNSIKVMISGDATGLTTALKASEDSVSKFKNVAQNVGSSVASGLKSVAQKAMSVAKVGAAAGTAAVLAIGKSAATSYADWEQLIGGVDTLFKESADKVDAYAQQAYKTAGLSANAYMETVTSFSASLLQSLGNDTAKAADYANQAVIDMSDNANKMGTDIARIQDAYNGFAKQNYTMLDNLKLGYGGTRTEMERLLADASKIAKIEFNIESFADVTQAIHVIQESMGIAGTTAKEGEETISGSLMQVKAAWQNILAFFGSGTTMAWNDIFPAFIKSVKTFAGNILPVIRSIVGNIADMIREIAPMIIEEIPAFLDEVLPGLIRAVYTIVETIFRALPNILTSFFSVLSDMIPMIVEAISHIIPVIIEGLSSTIPQIIDGMITLVQAIIPLIPSILRELVEGIISFILTLTDPKYMNAVLDTAIELLMVIVEALPTIIAAIANALPELIENIVQVLLNPSNSDKIVKAVIGLFAISKIRSGLKLAFSALSGSVSAAAQKAGSVVTDGMEKVFNSGAGEKIDTGFSSILGKLQSGVESIGNFIQSAINSLGGILSSVVSAVMEPVKLLLKGVGEAISGFFTALANPAVIAGAASFAAVAASIAAAIFLVGSAVGAIMPTIEALFNNVLIPVANFIANTVISLIQALSEVLINLTNSALIPLGEFMTGSFVTILNTVADTISRLTNNAVIPLVNTLQGAFVSVMQTVSNILNNVVKAALDGIANIVRGVSQGFESMGNVVIGAINSVNGVLGTFRDLILGISGAIVATVALVTGHSINYGHGYAHLFANGGVVGGTSYSGDQVLARVNSGEMVINRQQQAALWSFIENGSQGSSSDANFGDINVTVNAGSGDPQAIGEATAVATVKAIRRAFISQGLKPELANAGVLR